MCFAPLYGLVMLAASARLFHDDLDHAALGIEHWFGRLAAPDEMAHVSLEVGIDERDRPGFAEVQLAYVDHVPLEIKVLDEEVFLVYLLHAPSARVQALHCAGWRHGNGDSFF